MGRERDPGYGLDKLLIILDPGGARGIKTVNLTRLNHLSEKPGEDSAKLVKLMTVTCSPLRGSLR